MINRKQQLKCFDLFGISKYEPPQQTFGYWLKKLSKPLFQIINSKVSQVLSATVLLHELLTHTQDWSCTCCSKPTEVYSYHIFVLYCNGIQSLVHPD